MAERIVSLVWRYGRRAVVAVAVVGLVVAAAPASAVDGTAEFLSAPTGVADPDAADVGAVSLLSQDGTRVFFETAEKLTADDTDTNRRDVYERSGGVTSLVSRPTGLADPDTADAFLGRVSQDGTRVFISTAQRLTADDTDANRDDVYERSGGVTSLVSRAIDVPDPDTYGVYFAGVSALGNRVVVVTQQRLSSQDNDAGRSDVYAFGSPDPPPAPAPVPAPGPGPVDRIAPRITAFSFATRFRLGTLLPRLSAAVPTGTTIVFSSSEAARARLVFARRLAGRRVGRRCLAATRARRGRPRCTRLVSAGTLTVQARSGRNRLRFQGRLDRRRKLAAGSYRLTLTATDAAGNRLRAAVRSFTLLPALKPKR